MKAKRMIGIRIGKKIYVFEDPRPSSEVIEAAKEICIFMGKAAICATVYVGMIIAAAEVDQRL